MWKEQYERMLRGFRKIEEIYRTTYSRNDHCGHEIFEGRNNYQDIRDTVVHFFQDCFHLKDWIKNDLSVYLTLQDRNEIKNICDKKSSKVNLKICHDVANASKHFILNKYFSVDRNIIISPTGTAHVIEPDVNFSLKFNIIMPNNNRAIDALELAHNIVSTNGMKY